MRKNNISEIYANRINNNINDSFYVEGISWEGKIKSLRTYAEIIIRFILNMPEEHLTIGKKVKDLKQISNNNPLLLKSVEVISKYGDDNVHTEKTIEATEKDFGEMTDAIYNLYSYLYINYFEIYGYKCNRVLTMFSLLPPIIRCKTFSFLWEKDKTNPVLIDKLNLANLKTYGYEYAKNWIENNKALLEGVSSVSEDYIKALNKNIGDLSFKILPSGHKNMYEVCVAKLNSLKGTIEVYGPLYETYEEAISVYKEQMLEIQGVEEFSELEMKLKDIMDFCYKGRKGEPNNKNPAIYCLSELRIAIGNNG